MSGFPVTGVPLATSDDHFERQEIMLYALRQLNGVFSTITYYGDGHWMPPLQRRLGGTLFPLSWKKTQWANQI
jgi:hypothetical protein